jgi:hypothetical protein
MFYQLKEVSRERGGRKFDIAFLTSYYIGILEIRNVLKFLVENSL